MNGASPSLMIGCVNRPVIPEGAMRRPSPMLTAAAVRREAVARLVSALQLRDAGTGLTAALLAQVLVLAAVVRGSLSAVARLCRHAPGIETVRKGLHAQLPDDAELRRR